MRVRVDGVRAPDGRRQDPGRRAGTPFPAGRTAGTCAHPVAQRELPHRVPGGRRRHSRHVQLQEHDPFRAASGPFLHPDAAGNELVYSMEVQRKVNRIGAHSDTVHASGRRRAAGDV